MVTAEKLELGGVAPLAMALVLGALALIGLVALERDRLRRVLLALIDPRPLALLRICFGSLLLLGALEVAPLNIYLFSDEGLLPSPAVPQVYGRAALLGYGDGVRAPAGFTGGAGLPRLRGERALVAAVLLGQPGLRARLLRGSSSRSVRCS
jgi:hypothetical protein